jgi:hypothetical protein
MLGVIEYWYAMSCTNGGADQLTGAGDTKAGTLIATDKYGNKYFENIEEELPRKHQRA